jgi:hypothetical protein
MGDAMYRVQQPSSLAITGRPSAADAIDEKLAQLVAEARRQTARRKAVRGTMAWSPPRAL